MLLTVMSKKLGAYYISGNEMLFFFVHYVTVFGHSILKCSFCKLIQITNFDIFVNCTSFTYICLNKVVRNILFQCERAMDMLQLCTVFACLCMDQSSCTG